MDEQLFYFSYGSNMSTKRLKWRTPSAELIGAHFLPKHCLRYHKESKKDGSAKCNAFYTGEEEDVVHGALFIIRVLEKPKLDNAEGLGFGYEQKEVVVSDCNGNTVNAITYVASKTVETLKPYSWYLNHVLIGAIESRLPEWYIAKHIQSIEAIEDPDRERDAKERDIHR